MESPNGPVGMALSGGGVKAKAGAAWQIMPAAKKIAILIPGFIFSALLGCREDTRDRHAICISHGLAAAFPHGERATRAEIPPAGRAQGAHLCPDRETRSRRLRDR